MKKLLAILLVVATLFCIAACGDDNTTTTTTAPQGDTTTTTTQDEAGATTTVAQNDNATTTVAGEGDTTTTTVEDVTTTTTKPTTTTTTVKALPQILAGDGAAIDGVDPAVAANQNKVVDSVFTASNGGLQLKAEGWKTYGLYSISMVPEAYNNTGTTIAICVAVYPKGTDGYDDPAVFENKTEEDFEIVLQTNISDFGKGKITSNGKSYTYYKAVVTDTYYVWVIQTPAAKYFINFMQVEGQADMHAIGTQMINSMVIYK